MSAGRDAFATLIAMLEAAVSGKAPEEQEHRLGRFGVLWWKLHAEYAKQDPIGAGRLAAAMWHHLADHRPESPAPLDADFVPTETKAA